MQGSGATGPTPRRIRHVRAGALIATCLVGSLLAACGGDESSTSSITVAATSAATDTVDTASRDLPSTTGATSVTSVVPDTATDTAPSSGPSTANSSSGPAEPASDASCAVSFEVLAELPHDPTAFTQGLVVDGEVLHESTGLYGESTVRTVDPATGDVLRETALPDDHFGEGLALLGDELFQLTWREGVVHVYDRDLAPLRTISSDGEGWGLTTDGDELVLSDGSSTLSWIDPATWTTTRRVTVVDDGLPIDRLNELELVDGAVLANVWREPVVAVVDPSSGEVTGWLDLTTLLPDPSELDDPGNDVLNGIAVDPATGHLFVTGKRWPVLYELDVDRSCWPGRSGATP